MSILDAIKADIRVLFGKPDYWHPRIRANYNLKDRFSEGYYLDLSSKADYQGQFDDQGIPLVEIQKKLQYVPVAISHYALACYQRYLSTNQDEDLKKFFLCINWFEKNYETINSSCVWLSHYERKLYSLKPPWTSALVQGQVMSVLCRGYSITRNSNYIDLALKAAKTFEIPVNQGGVRISIGNRDLVFYEEFPSSKPSYVLNGFIFSLWGLYDLYLVSQEKSVLTLYQKGLETLIWILPRYDFYSWPRYDLYGFKIPNICNIFYASLHIEQLRVMSAITENEIFKRYADRWAKGRRKPYLLIVSQTLMILHKIYVKLTRMVM